MLVETPGQPTKIAGFVESESCHADLVAMVILEFNRKGVVAMGLYGAML